jgi:hypothetical protein
MRQTAHKACEYRADKGQSIAKVTASGGFDTVDATCSWWYEGIDEVDVTPYDAD